MGRSVCTKIVSTTTNPHQIYVSIDTVELRISALILRQDQGWHGHFWRI